MRTKEVDFEPVKGNPSGRYPALYLALIVPVLERPAGDGDLRRAVGSDDPRLGSDPLGG